MSTRTAQEPIRDQEHRPLSKVGSRWAGMPPAQPRGRSRISSATFKTRRFQTAPVVSTARSFPEPPLIFAM